MTKIELSEDEVPMFILYQKHFDMMKKLDAARVFDVRNGEAILSFNNDGVLMGITINMRVYRNVHK